MKILYIGKHDSGFNDDEGAVVDGFRSLGHEVERLQEGQTRLAGKHDADFLLFNKLNDDWMLRRLPMPKVFWYWDRVDDPDPALAARSRHRRQWMRGMTELVDVGFVTDGDWVAQDRTGKLAWLPQGADQRIAGRGHGYGGCSGLALLGSAGPVPEMRREDMPALLRGPRILMTGIRNGGGKRQSFVAEMEQRHGNDFRLVERGLHGELLKELIARAEIVVAPDGPASDRYWSNRVYLTLGFGGFLIHPWCRNLCGQYSNGNEIVLYQNRSQLHEAIAHYMERPAERALVAEQGLARTLKSHLYVHRCQQLIATVKERMGWN